MNYPLQGIKVIDCGSFHAGPGTAAILADLGAEVIKVEQTGIGDPVREIMYFGNADFSHNGRSLFFEGANRNKKSITLNLKDERGREILMRLVKETDVFVTNFRRNALEKLKLTYEQLRQVNPSLVYGYISGNGTQGPESQRGGFDSQGQARSGLMFCMGEPSMPPISLHFGVLDQTTAIMASHGILAALVMRERSGVGQEIDVSILGSAMFAQYFNVMMPLVTGMELDRYERKNADPLRNYYRCGDDRWISLQAIPRHEDNWQIFCKVIDHPEMVSDPRFNTEEGRMGNRRELIEMIDEIFMTKPRDEWDRLFKQHDFISSPVNKPSDLNSDPQVIANGYIGECDHPLFGKVQMPAYPVHFSQAQTGPYEAAPELGAQTEEVLREFGGYSDQEIRRFRDEGII